MTMTSLLPPASRGSAASRGKTERAYTWLRDRIVRHDYVPGYRLVLGPIAAELGMSVVPVREAVRRLEAEGLVTIERHVGARVAVVDEAEYVHTMQTLGIVEGAATALSAPLLTTDDLDEAAEINARLAAVLEDFHPQTFTRLNQDFHRVLFRHCPNPQVLQIVERGWQQLAAIRLSSFVRMPDRAEQSVAEHAELLRLIGSSAPAGVIEQAARDHRWRTLEAYLERRSARGGIRTQK